MLQFYFYNNIKFQHTKDFFLLVFGLLLARPSAEEGLTISAVLARFAVGTEKARNRITVSK